jgi:hypothetical protein
MEKTEEEKKKEGREVIKSEIKESSAYVPS